MLVFARLSEAQVGLKKYVACHGSFLTASCLSCKKKRTADGIRVSFFFS